MQLSHQAGRSTQGIAPKLPETSDEALIFQERPGKFSAVEK